MNAYDKPLPRCRPCTYRAIAPCTVWRLCLADLHHICSIYPEVRVRLVDGMHGHLERIAKRDPHPLWWVSGPPAVCWRHQAAPSCIASTAFQAQCDAQDNICSPLSGAPSSNGDASINHRGVQNDVAAAVAEAERTDVFGVCPTRGPACIALCWLGLAVIVVITQSQG